MGQLTAIAVALLAVAACTVERADVRTPSGEPPEADTTRVRMLVDEIARAYETGDLAALDTIYHDSASVYEGGRVDSSWPAYRDEHLAAELAEPGDRRLAFDDIRIRLSGGTALVTCRYRLTAARQGEQIAVRGLSTMVFRRFGGRWRLVHAHWSTD